MIGNGEGLRDCWRWIRRWRVSLTLSIVVFCTAAGGLIPSSAFAATPIIEEESVLDVSATSATLQAKVNPEESPTNYKFDYGIGESEGYIGEGNESVAVRVHPQDLAPDTVYHFHIVVSNVDGEIEQGMDQSFTTQSLGGELALPDQRVWELVSPAIKDGALITPIEEAGGLTQAAESGGAITYLSDGPLKSVQSEEEAPAGNADETQVLSMREAGGGWSSLDIATPHEVSAGVSVGKGQEYRSFSPDLSVGIVQPFGSGFTGSEAPGASPLSESASEKAIYLRADIPLVPNTSEREAYFEAGGEGGYLPLVTGCPPEGESCKPKVQDRANVPPGARFGGDINFVGATPDLAHVIIASSIPLTTNTPEGQNTEGAGIYEWTRGRLQLVSILPEKEGQAASGASFGNSGERDARNAVSSDGSSIFWSYDEHLFVRAVASEQTARLDIAEAGVSEEGESLFGAQFQFASTDGSKAFFTDEKMLTTDSGAAEHRPDLYECELTEEVASKLTCNLSDLSSAPGIHANVQGVALSGGENSSDIYFVAKGELTGKPNELGEKAKGREDNLYTVHYSKEKKMWEPPTFIAVLSNQDSQDWEGEAGDLESLTTRVSPNGDYLAFMSDRSLTGYNNTDVNSGESDEEVYLYSSVTDRLLCVACNSTGERPVGVQDSSEAGGGNGLLVDRQKLWSGGRWLAANVPGWTAMSLETARYQSRYLSSNGRGVF